MHGILRQIGTPGDRQRQGEQTLPMILINPLELLLHRWCLVTPPYRLHGCRNPFSALLRQLVRKFSDKNATLSAGGYPARKCTRSGHYCQGAGQQAAVSSEQ